MRMLRHLVAAMLLLTLAAVLTGCYWPYGGGYHRRGYERGDYEHERGDYQRERGRGDHGRDSDRERHHERERDYRD